MIYKKVAITAIMCVTFFASGLSVSAEDIEPAGFHVYDVQEDQASDNWYGISRGTYLRAAVAKIVKGSAAKYASCSGTTFAHQDCDRVFVRIYLEISGRQRKHYGISVRVLALPLCRCRYCYLYSRK